MPATAVFRLVDIDAPEGAGEATKVARVPFRAGHLPRRGRGTRGEAHRARSTRPAIKGDHRRTLRQMQRPVDGNGRAALLRWRDPWDKGLFKRTGRIRDAADTVAIDRLTGRGTT